MFPGPLGISLLGKALANKLWSLEVRDIRDHGLGKHRSVDDTPAGGGPGMVMRADVAAAAIDAVARDGRPPAHLSFAARSAADAGPRAALWRPAPARSCCAAGSRAWTSGLIEARDIEEISLGDFVLAGGEIAAMALIEAAVRLIPGVLGEPHPRAGGEFRRPAFWNIRNSPGPRSFEGMPIPDVLNQRKSFGNCQMAAGARRKHLTKARRPDLWTLYEKAKSR